MSREALAKYKGARDLQLLRNEARHIRTRVHEARQARHVAGVRWPFELLQNALDAGPRVGRDFVTIHVRDEGDRIVFEHDGAPFSSDELAALLSGGSSKDFGSEEKTGRFGTGFLVTHVLAERTSLEGLLSIGTELERFSLTLDRSGDEASILENIDRCNEAIEQARPVESVHSVPSARFEYPIEDDRTLALGVEAFRAALPYLYGTCKELGEVHMLRRDGTAEFWSCENLTQEELEGGVVEERLIRIVSEGEPQTYRIARVSSRSDSDSAALILTQPMGEAWKIVLPKGTDPRIYRQYPLRSSGFLPVNFIFDGHFDPDQERSRVLMTDPDKEALLAAFDAAITGVKYAFRQRWTNAHLLARASAPTSSFDPDDVDERQWWRDALRAFAERIANLPLVETRDGDLSAKAAEPPYADFILPQLDEASSADETSVDRLWPLVNDTVTLIPPIEELATDWSETANGWGTLGVELIRVTVEMLGRSVRGDASEIAELEVNDDPFAWLARYIDVVGECWQRRGGVDPSAVDGLLPSQTGVLSPARGLRRDLDVPEELKEICEAVELDVRKGLLSIELTESISSLSLEYAEDALTKALPNTADSNDIRTELLEYLKSKLPEDGDCSDANERFQRGTAQLLSYLWKTGGEEMASIAREVPLITKGKKIAYWSSGRVMMAPVSAWDVAAQPFSDAYPPDRVLADMYGTIAPAIISALEAWKMAYRDPIVTATAAELSGRRLAAMVRDDFRSEGVTVRGEKFGYIALLQPEILNHVQDLHQAKALLGMVLCHIVRNDHSWQVWRTVRGTRERESLDVPICNALWLGDLRSRVWIPVRGEDDKPAKVAADATTLRALLEPSWLDKNDNAIEFLTDRFGFDELDLRLLGIGSEVQDRVRQGLARILESGGADPDFYESLADEIEARRQRNRDIDRCRGMGYAVQDAVRRALEAHGLTVTLVDRGFDYEVSAALATEVLEDAAMHFEVGPYFVEVKATSTGAARLTPAQAETAAETASHYVLCVVDLRGVSKERLDEEWDGKDVEPLASLVTDIGGRVMDTCVLVHRARESAIGIRNETALRYEVSPETWMTGISIADWVASITNKTD